MLDWLRSMTPSQAFALTSMYVAGLSLLGIGAFFGLTKGGSAMALATSTPVPSVAIPSIDLNAPGETETATFGLG